jgi:hypothetical protein
MGDRVVLDIDLELNFDVDGILDDLIRKYVS